MFLKKEKGISLIEMLVTIGIMLIVMTMVIQSFYMIRKDYKYTLDRLMEYEQNIEAKAIFKNLIHNAYIGGNGTYSFLKKMTTSVGNQSIVQPFEYPLIYAKRAPLVEGGFFGSDFPTDAQEDTDVLVLQTIDTQQILDVDIGANDTSISREITSNTSNVPDNVYMMLTNETNQTLLKSKGSKTSNDAIIDLEEAVGQEYASGSVLYTNYAIRIIYVRDTSEVDDDGNIQYELYEVSYQTNNTESSQTLLKGVKNLQISYSSDGLWKRVSATDDISTWYSEIKGVKISYELNGLTQEVISSFDDIGYI